MKVRMVYADMCGDVLFEVVRCGTVWCGAVRYGAIRFISVICGAVYSGEVCG